MSLLVDHSPAAASLQPLFEAVHSDAARKELVVGPIGFSLVRALSAKSVIFCGGDDSLIPLMLALALQDANGGTLQRVDIRNPYQLPGASERDNSAQRAGLLFQSSYPSHVAVTQSTADEFSERGRPIDLVLLDADHSFVGVAHDFEKFARRADYVLLWDSAEDAAENPAFPHVRQFANRLQRPWVELSINPCVVLIDNRC